MLCGWAERWPTSTALQTRSSTPSSPPSSAAPFSKSVAKVYLELESMRQYSWRIRVYIPAYKKIQQLIAFLVKKFVIEVCLFRLSSTL